MGDKLTIKLDDPPFLRMLERRGFEYTDAGMPEVRDKEATA